jgi:hypothetical protein
MRGLGTRSCRHVSSHLDLGFAKLLHDLHDRCRGAAFRESDTVTCENMRDCKVLRGSGGGGKLSLALRPLSDSAGCPSTLHEYAFRTLRGAQSAREWLRKRSSPCGLF